VAPTVYVSPEDLEAFAKRIEARISPHLDRAQRLLSQVRGVEQTLFTSVTWTLSTVYVVATEFTGEDIKSKSDDLYEIVGKLNETARRWAQTEDKNTAKGH
jgi:hypothetical protein